jgi:serine O-acetyltransferase
MTSAPSPGLRAQIREDLSVYRGDWTQAGFRALAVHRIGTWVQPKRGRVWSLLRRLHMLMYRYVRNHYGIELHYTTVVGRRVLIAHPMGVAINGRTVIGDDCIIYQNVTLGARNGERVQEAPTLGRGVTVGCGAAVLGPVTIGDEARIGPNVVVMTDVPAGATVFVTPPRMLLKMRAAAKIEQADTNVEVGATRK